MSRRKFLGAGALGAAIGSSAAGLAAAGGTRPRTLQVFNQRQASTYAAWCDVLAIGAAESGVAFFVDKYLAGAYPDSLLLLRYLQNPPFKDFYLKGIAGIDQESEARFSKAFLALGENQRTAIVDSAVKASTKAWKDPDPNFFYFISRSDAVDVVYGTVAGFRALDIPYLPHIQPSQPW